MNDESYQSWLEEKKKEDEARVKEERIRQIIIEEQIKAIDKRKMESMRAVQQWIKQKEIEKKV